MYHTIILTKNKQLFAIGNNYFGQLGLGDNNINRNIPTLLIQDKTIRQVVCGSSD